MRDGMKLQMEWISRWIAAQHPNIRFSRISNLEYLKNMLTKKFNLILCGHIECHFEFRQHARVQSWHQSGPAPICSIVHALESADKMLNKYIFLHFCYDHLTVIIWDSPTYVCFISFLVLLLRRAPVCSCSLQQPLP